MLIHIGYHKTASTTLQNEVFIERFGFKQFASREDVHRLLVDTAPLDVFPAQASRYLVKRASEVACSGQIPVLSHERLSGYPASGGFDQLKIAISLHKLFPQAKILAVFREQRSLIYSFWKQYIVDGGSLSLRHFLSPGEVDSKRVPAFDLAYYDFFEAYEFYRNLFGENNVLFIPFELLVDFPMEFTNRILEFAGRTEVAELTQLAERNTSRSLVILTLMRVLNRFMFMQQLSPCGLLDTKVRLFHLVQKSVRTGLDRIDFFHGLDGPLARYHKRRIEHVVGDFYRTSNIELSRMMGTRLSDLGYR